MAGRRSGAKMIYNRNEQEEGDVVVKVSEKNFPSDDDDQQHHNSPPTCRINNNKIPKQQQPKTRGITTSCSSPPKYLEPPPNKQTNNVHATRRTTQQRAAAAPTSSRGDHEYGSSAVPRFGEWEEKDHVSEQGYTRAFERITDQRNMPGGGYVQCPCRATPKQTPHTHQSTGWCFFWRRKYK